MKKLIGMLVSVAAVAALCCALVGCGSGSTSSKSSPSDGDEAVSGTVRATIQVEGYDPIEVDLDADSAPISVERFTTLAKNGYYDGLRFYRIVQGFCLQGGTIGDSASGDDSDLEPIVGEFTENKQDNPLSEDFRRGTIAMARTGQYDSAKSTFFITLATSVNVSNSLDGQYAAFGKVTADGMKVVDQIVYDYSKYATGNNGAIDNPVDMPVIQSITIEE